MHEAEKKLGSQELLKHYALAKAGLERQAVKEAEARAIAQEKGEEYEDKDYAGLTGLIADILGLNEQEYKKLTHQPINKVFQFAEQRGLVLQDFIEDCEAITK